MTFTPQFIEFCKKEFGMLKPVKSGLIRPFSQTDAQKMLKDISNCTSQQLEYIQEKAQKYKNKFNEHVAQLAHISKAKQDEINTYKQFFADLEKKLEQASRDTKNNSNTSQLGSNSSYKPSAPSGQSFYDSIMHILGYDATTVGASAMFFLVFSALRFMVGTPYWAQLAEYNAADAAKRFDPKNLTDEQIKMNLDKNSTRNQVIEAGFLPPPNLAHAFDVEFKTFMQKLGTISKQEEDRPNQLGRKLLHPT